MDLATTEARRHRVEGYVSLKVARKDQSLLNSNGCLSLRLYASVVAKSIMSPLANIAILV